MRIDNEVSATFHDLLAEEHLVPEFEPPLMHRRNEGGRAIRTAKNHIIATLTNADPAFPMAAVEHTTEQAEITINLLRQAPNDPTPPSKSAWKPCSADNMLSTATHSPLSVPEWWCTKSPISEHHGRLTVSTDFMMAPSSPDTGCTPCTSRELALHATQTLSRGISTRWKRRVTAHTSALPKSSRWSIERSKPSTQRQKRPPVRTS